MHYKNGREAKVGDQIVHPVWTKDGYVTGHGIITSITPGSTSCNAVVIPVSTPGHCVTLGHCLHREDIVDGVGVEEKDAVKLKPSDV